jgi:SAM-dependent MidA family methyltransferase
MWSLLRERGARRFDLVEAGAGDGRLTRDILFAAARNQPELYDRLAVTLVERSDAARGFHSTSLRGHITKLSASCEHLPSGVIGVIVANELLDALPVHVVAASHSGLCEIYVTERNGVLLEVEGPLSPSVAEYMGRDPIALNPGVRAEIGLQAIQWISDAAAALESGFLLVFDYGLPQSALYSDTRRRGTLTTYRRHTATSENWLENPGAVDITAHVNLSAITRAAEAAGLTTLGITDQTYFLLSLGVTERLSDGNGAQAISERLSAKTLLMPGGLGSTLKVLAFSKALGRPKLRGFSSARLT